MTDFPHSPVRTAADQEKISSGLVIVTPLSKDNCEKANTITDEITRRLGFGLWTPHQDITHGRILPGESRLTRPELEEIITLSGIALQKAVRPGGNITAKLDSIQASEEAVIARATGDVGSIVDLRRWFVKTLEPIPGATPSVKRTDFVHTTLGRRNPGGEEIPVEDVLRVAREVGGVIGEKLPIIQEIGTLVIAEETERYVLVPRDAIDLG